MKSEHANNPVQNASDRYTFDELYEHRLDDYYRFYDEFSALLVKSLCFLSRDEADSVLDRTFFIPFYGSSWHFSGNLIKGRAVVIIDAKDLESNDEAIITILHEAAHLLLGHGDRPQAPTQEEIHQREDACWRRVRDWLPAEFSECIDRAEQLGGGAHGIL